TQSGLRLPRLNRNSSPDPNVETSNRAARRSLANALQTAGSSSTTAMYGVGTLTHRDASEPDKITILDFGPTEPPLRALCTYAHGTKVSYRLRDKVVPLSLGELGCRLTD